MAEHYLKEWRVLRGLTLEALGKLVGTDKTQISKLQKRRHLTTTWMMRLAPPLGINPDDLMRAPNPDTVPNIDFPRARQIPAESKVMLPVYAAASAGRDGETIDLDHPVDETPCPPELIGVEGACGILISGSSMEPRYFDGEIVLIDPRKPLTPRKGVLVELDARSALIKFFVRWLPDRGIEVEQFNPAKNWKIPASEIVRVYRVVGLRE